MVFIEPGYPVKHLGAVSGFDPDVHDHLLLLRNTLIAHDDFEQIEPRLLSTGITKTGVDFHIPMSVAVANKCLSHPAQLDGAEKMASHVRSAFKGIHQKLNDDLGRCRQAAIDHPDQVKEIRAFGRSLGTFEVPKGGTRLETPDTKGSPWLDAPEPDFSEVHSGYRYEKVTVVREFTGPERIKLPDGTFINITPSGPC